MNRKQRVFAEEYLTCWSAAEAARRAGYAHADRQGSRLLRNVEIAGFIQACIEDKAMTRDEVLLGLAEQARANLGDFFKVVEEWTFYPLPTADIIDAREVVDDSDPDNPRTRVSYWVRRVAIDTDRLTDPRYAKLLHKFADSPKNGVGIELYNKQEAYKTLGKYLGLFTERLDVTSGGEPIKSNDGHDRAISALADALREIVSGAVAGESNPVDAAEQTAVVSTTEPGG